MKTKIKSNLTDDIKRANADKLQRAVTLRVWSPLVFSLDLGIIKSDLPENLRLHSGSDNVSMSEI